MLVGERRNGNLLVQLDPKLQAQPVELLRQRLSPDGHTEYLIRWALQNVEEVAGSSGTTSQTESKSPNILMWMSAEEVYTNCPTLLGKRKPEGPGIAEEKTSGSPDEGALQEMTEDVRMLVQRASRQMSQSLGPDSSILNTIHVLSAYASIGSLAGVFKETGALDLLMKMLCNSEKQIRKNAGKMLRALASHDAGSRAHVLLSLSQQDGIEQHMDFESRYTLLQLFAETTSSEEHCISFEGIHLPQIPGKQLFSLVKRYLCVTSLLDQLSSDRPDRTEMSRLQRHFDFSMAMGSLICELVRVMGWVPVTPSKGWIKNDRQSSFSRKGFPPCTDFPRAQISPVHRLKVGSDFSHRSDHLEYMKQVLLPGMSVQLLEDSEPLKAGDEGVFMQSIMGHYLVEVHWHRLGHIQPVHLSMLEIRKHISFPVAITRDEWWEILFFLQQLEVEARGRVMEVIGGHLEMGLLPFISVSVDVAQKILSFMVKNCNGRLLSDLQASHVYNQFYGKSHNTDYWGDFNPPFTPTPHNTQVEVSQGADVGSSDLQTLNNLLLLEGVEICEKARGMSSDHDMEIKRSLENCRVLAPDVLHIDLDHEWKSSDKNLEGTQRASGNSAFREKMVGMLVELLTSQVKDKLLVLTCLELTYLVMSRYDWRVLFATEGGVRAVLGCMQEHHSSAAVQHIGLAVLKVLTGGDGDIQGPSKRNILNPADAQVIKEIFSSIGSAASGTSSSLLRAIPCAIAKMRSMEGCSSSVYNGFLVLWMLMEDDEDLSSILHRDLPSLAEPRRHFLLHCCLPTMVAGRLHDDRTESSPGLAVQEMDLSSLLSGLKDIRMCREMLPSLERCVCDDVSSLSCDVPQLLTDLNFFLQLLSCLEQLMGEKRLQLCVYRILNKALDLYDENTLPWHKSIAPSLRILEASSGDRELFQEVIRFLHNLAAFSKDCAMVMCGLRAADILSRMLNNQSSDERTLKLRDLLTSYETYSVVHHKMTAYVVAGCMQIVLTQIDEHRICYQKLSVPLLDVFLRSLVGASIRTEEKEDKCWEKIEVSSNPHRANKLTDGNPKSYWESSGSTGSHYINISMHRGVVIRQLVMVVASEDSSYMPARVVVMGGENPSNINTELNAVNIASTAGRVLLLENVTRFWPIIQIKIKRCQQGGIDTRVRGLEILGPKPTFWPVFKEQLCRRTFLFYTSRAHSWGQEICDKKENLLHLFSRLNGALSHEQEFAERFLPDEEAALALGRTCWEALISPLVQSITTSDPGGFSPLGWLLTRYLENSQSSRPPKSRLSVFNSRVRRLTHLLVHVDTNPPDTTVLRPPNKSNGKNRSSTSVPATSTSCGMGSMAGMAQCWQGVVQQQVQHFLERSWNDVNLVPRFCSMYVALRRAMDEMFGQQTRLLLALQQGFCQGLLQLSFLTALHVTEQFARYIDQRIIAIRSDSSDFQGLEQLQQFLECVLFLSDLELSNSFEHFYRHYLADRLLTLGPCWLENSVVDHIGICFPNRFPQQMLKNLQEGKDLQREEHLYRLQQLDNGVISEDEEGMVPLSGAVGMEESLDFKVCVLSSQCWPICSRWLMDDPEKYFSHTVIHHLLRFTNFFRKSGSFFPGSSHIDQSRRLQWTWLGNAKVQYGGLLLRVSTLQMFILLQFNQQEEILEEDLVNWTGVSDGLIRNCLQPLTAKRGILGRRQDTGCLYVDTSALSDRAGSIVTLIPAWADGVPDVSSMEKKRRLILQEVEEVMKEERHIHIDALVAKVIEASRKWKDLSPAPYFGVTDVLSCIMYQLRNGAIYRKTNNPLILACKEDSPPSPPPLISLLSHTEPVTPVPPQVSEFCSVRKIPNNIGAVLEERPIFRTFRYPE